MTPPAPPASPEFPAPPAPPEFPAPPEPPAALLALDRVRVRFPVRSGGLLRREWLTAVDGVSLQVGPGQVTGIVGESGSGKSTVARVLIGLQRPTSGRVLFEGRPVEVRSALQRRRLGRAVQVVFQDPSTALNPRLSVADILTDPLAIHRIGDRSSRRARVAELLDLVGLPRSAAEVVPRQLSGGQRQRVAIARALALRPRVIVADEPTSALDVSVRAQILNLLADLRAELGLGMIFISHDIQTVRYVSDEIIVMKDGRVVERGPVEQIFTAAREPYTVRLLAAAPALLRSPTSAGRGAAPGSAMRPADHR